VRRVTKHETKDQTAMMQDYPNKTGLRNGWNSQSLNGLNAPVSGPSRLRWKDILFALFWKYYLLRNINRLISVTAGIW
jgi:hypothetical protein